MVLATQGILKPSLSFVLNFNTDKKINIHFCLKHVCISKQFCGYFILFILLFY